MEKPPFCNGGLPHSTDTSPLATKDPPKQEQNFNNSALVPIHHATDRETESHYKTVDWDDSLTHQAVVIWNSGLVRIAQDRGNRDHPLGIENWLLSTVHMSGLRCLLEEVLDESLVKTSCRRIGECSKGNEAKNPI